MQHPEQTTRGAERSAGAPSRSLHLTRLPAYLAAGVGAAGLATSADAQIVPIDLTNLGTGFNVTGVNGGVTAGSKITIDDWLGANTGRLEIYNIRWDGNDRYHGLDGDSLNSISLQFAVGSTSVDANPSNFSFNSSIDSTRTFSSSADKTVFNYLQNAPTPGVPTGATAFTSPDFGAGSYMGFRFGTSGSYKYGWLEVTWNSTTEEFRILSGAYESSLNTPILAGATGSTPVPESTASGGLMGLLLGGAALRQWRKSRNKADVA
ncbi:MAG: hypothetical protein RLZ45_3006, partial [Verrucomicrobiota bacterium]